MEAAATSTYSQEISNWAVTGAASAARVPYNRDRSSVTYLASAAVLAAATMYTPALYAQGSQEANFVGGEHDYADQTVSYFVDERSLLIEELRQYERLEAGWDGSKSDVAPSREAIDEAISFVETLPPFVALPEPMVSSDGEVGLFWDEGLYLDVGFRGKGECTFYGCAGADTIKGKETVSLRDAIPADLLTFFANARVADAMQL